MTLKVSLRIAIKFLCLMACGMPLSILMGLCVTKECTRRASAGRHAATPTPRGCAIGGRNISRHRRRLPFLILLLVLLSLGGSDSLAQHNVPEFPEALGDKLILESTDFTLLEQGESVIKLLPARDKREIAMCGMIRLQAPAEKFLQSFRENMTRKSNPAILEIGRLGTPPSLDDFRGLTIEDRDVEDLRQCVIGDCRLKLSAPMIQRLQEEVDWTPANYRTQATQVLKEMLVEYVRDYLARGDEALIRYDDKAKAIRVADEQHELIQASSFGSLFEDRNGILKPELTLVDDAIVWSKIKFGLKPVLAIDHILIYHRAQQHGAQVLILSKQIYANHYFDSSVALTAFMNLTGQNPGSYLFYENRSRVDGLEGPFGKFKRGIIEGKAVNSLRSILHQSQSSLAAPTMNADSSAASAATGWNWRRWRVNRINVVILLFWVSAFAMYLGWRSFGSKVRQSSSDVRKRSAIPSTRMGTRAAPPKDWA